MTGKTHIMGGVASCTAAAYLYGYDPVFMTASGVIGALIPDICHTKSKIGRRLPILSAVVSSVFGHRTFTHSLLFLLITAFAAHLYFADQSILVGLMAGMASHLLLDAGTVNGIKLFFPSAIKVRLPLYIKTGGKAEQVVLAVLTVVSCYFIANLIA
ncbi:metal-dependent hydrolase [Bacillus licheniformis]|uniref:metal-dependent hydrolase n=1 Tax=Bacillus licheniformis TaxID=1402 RepID=UPI000BA6036E|nr:metal-dependent hydrolase [Bacillus licheniformis]MBK4207151.1 metal-dependent hydrolase [Bacillus licheniformis]MBU8561408.1 metal-dependent hydrolase [Bacillus licheniformis]MDE1366390.1 metal-dependent hydrolase [Bacillus licheniformis]MDE1434481.1 metal-dependent hydrolase [Bacillus licheniformis]MEC1245912.1 metal-dependent hydrolase [Bacillus licheniformis]